ncbi:MAG: sulfite exporter TauE/SafE family protein [Pseudomonadota bacterium]
MLPDAISSLTALLIILASFLASMLTAAVGIGGGLALLAIMTALLPPLTVIPVHAVAQWGSNGSRFVLLAKDTYWPIIAWFALGSLLGAAIGGQLYVQLPERLLKLGIASFILYSVWGPKPKSFTPGKTTFVSTGAISTFLTMFFGATGPIVASMMATTSLNRTQIVATHAAAMVCQHGIKAATFGALGFAFEDWLGLIAGIVAAGFAGAWVGTRILKRTPEERFQKIFRAVLTTFAAYLVLTALVAGRQS